MIEFLRFISFSWNHIDTSIFYVYITFSNKEKSYKDLDYWVEKWEYGNDRQTAIKKDTYA